MEPTALPAIGHPEHLRDFLCDSVGCLSALERRYGSAVAFAKGSSHAVFTFGPEFHRQLLTRPDAFHISSGIPGPKNSAQRRFGAGMFNINGEQHERHRRLLMPPFRKEAVESYHDRLVAVTDELLSDWQPGQVRDIVQEMKALAIRVTGRILFGLDDFALGHEIAATFDDWVELCHAVSFASLLPIEPPAGSYERLLDAASRLEKKLLELLAQKRVQGTDGPDLLAILLRARRDGLLGDVDVIGQTHSLFNAAYHTTTYALTWSVFLLAQHPDVARRLLADLCDHVAGAAPAPAELGRVPLLDAVIKESMRLLPPVVYYARINVAPIGLGPYALPARTLIVASLYVTHHLAELFPRPQCFDPDRWRNAAVSPYAHLPFGGGPRLCLGAPFAMLMLKIALATIVRRFRLSVLPGTRIDRHATLTLGPRGAIPARVYRQDGLFTAAPVSGQIHEMVELPAAEAPAIAA